MNTPRSVLAIENTTINGSYVTVEAVVDEMQCIRRADNFGPAEYAPALCRADFQLDEGEQVPVDEDGFCSYLDQLDLEWQLIDTSDY